MTPLCAVRRAWIAAAVAASASADASARCFTYCGKASHGGGLASFFYFLNAAKLIADHEGARFLVPEVVPLSRRHAPRGPTAVHVGVARFYLELASL